MENENKKLTPEQLQLLQQMMMRQQGSGKTIDQGPQPKIGLKERLSKITAKGVFISILQNMQHGVKFIDQFTNLIVKEDGGNANDVVKSARSPILFGSFVIIFFVVFGTIWAAVAPLDSAAVAQGTVVSSSLKKIINHQEGGILKKILVQIGDKVNQGDNLIELDDAKIKFEYEQILNQYRSLLGSEYRLMAEINEDEQVNYPQFLLQDKADPNVAKIIETQDNLFNSKRKYNIAEKNSLEQKIKQTYKQIDGYIARKKSLAKSIAVTKDRLKATKTLNTKGYVQKSALLELEAKEAQLESELAVTDTEIARSDQEITKTNIELLNVDNRFSSANLNELKETQTNLSGARERLMHTKDALNRIIIKSPVDGIVNNIAYNTIGSSIPPGQTIIEISPQNDPLVIDAKVEPKNIDSISVGLVSKIRFSAFKSRTTPLFTGKVVSISPDIVNDNLQRAGNDPLANGYYLVRIELDMDNFEALAKPRKLELHPGMSAEVQIVNGTRTLLNYLLDPVYDAMFKGFKEK